MCGRSLGRTPVVAQLRVTQRLRAVASSQSSARTAVHPTLALWPVHPCVCSVLMQMWEERAESRADVARLREVDILRTGIPHSPVVWLWRMHGARQDRAHPATLAPRRMH